MGSRASTRTVLLAAALTAAAIAAAGCRALGFTSRVLWRVTSPDGRLVAVCQEIPAFDGPGYDIRLERPDGAAVRHLAQLGDGDPCTELAWSPDGKMLAVLSGHVARVRVVDVGWTLRQPVDAARQRSWPIVDFSTARHLRVGRGLRFTAPFEIDLTVCGYNLRERQRTGESRCTDPARHERFRVPQPIAAARR